MRNGQGKEVASTHVMIKKYVKLDPDDEFNSTILIKRHEEQLNNKHKPSKWCRLHVTNDELWLSGAYWWPNSILNGIHLSEINCLVTFYSTPSILALGIASRLYQSDKEYVILRTKSGTDREQLVKTLTTLCGNRCKQSQKKFNVPIIGPSIDVVDIILSPDLKQSVDLGKSKEIIHEPSIYSTSCNNSETFIKETAIKVERSISPVHISTVTATHDNPITTTTTTTTTTTGTSTNVDDNIFNVDNYGVSTESHTVGGPFTISPSQKPYQAVQWMSNENLKPYRLKRFMAPYSEGLESGLNPKDLIHIRYHPKHGNIITQDGSIYLYCVNCPNE
ncbi:hypothetical protein EWB00_011111 [Schistosoma japonicum]|uniref:Uncharacterized protein n=1 Tax=Schistosoma japonicum TaxID=6182 RepID=A0A4Z2DLI7_SCHJA|nr:hypothetical protein EWB00_011111 [Schistosoma japonicum]